MSEDFFVFQKGTLHGGEELCSNSLASKTRKILNFLARGVVPECLGQITDDLTTACF